MKTESYKYFEEIQSKLHKQFDNVRLSAEHVLWLSENFQSPSLAEVKLPDLPTDSEIETQIKECGLDKVPEGQQYWEGAKWMRDQFKSSPIQGDKEGAVKFLEFVMEWGDTQDNVGKSYSELYDLFKQTGK